MNFKQFTKQLKQNICGASVLEESMYHGVSIIFTEEGEIFVNNKKTDLTSIDEAKQYVRQINLEEELVKEMYGDIPHAKIAGLIKEHHNVKVTDTLIESYVELASSKMYTTDPVVNGIRALNSADNLLEGKIDYVLNDGSVIAIDEETNKSLNTLLADKTDIVQYMRESKANFMHIVKELN